MKILKTIFLISLLFLFSCKKETFKFYYPSSKEFKISDSNVILKLTDFEDFSQIQDSLRNYKERLIILVQNNNQKYYIKPVKLKDDTPPVTKEKNQIGISKDSVIKNGVIYPIDSLSVILKRDLLNLGETPFLAESPEKLTISFLNPEQETILDLKNNLLNLFKIFNRLEKNETNQLNIEFGKIFIPKPLPKE